MRALLVVLLLIGCRGEKPASKQPAKPEAPKQEQLEQATSGVDPWAVAANPDDPPDIAERNRLANAACPSVTGPYFYRIEKAGKVSHILGTRHVGVPLSKFPKPVQDAIDNAKLAVFEVAPGDNSDLDQQEIYLPDALGPDLWKRYKELVGVTLAKELERTTPSVAVLALMVLYEDIGATLDMEIERKVIAAGVPTGGLEAAVFQDRLLNKLLDIRMLKASIKATEDRKKLEQESRDDLAEYCAGTDTVPGMDDDMRADMLAAGYSKTELDAIDEEMVFRRNEDWIPKLEKILEKDKTFIAVGADHLTGERGVVKLLEKRGYKLTRITK